MTDPVTATIIALSATGVGVAAYGQYQAGRAAEQQAKAEAAWNAYNAQVARREEEAEQQAAAFEAQQQARQAEQISARLRARRGKAGITMEGSPLLVAEDTAAQLALENAMIRMTGARKAARWRSQSILDISMASAAKARGAAARQTGMYRAGGTLLSGAGQVGFMGYEMGLWGQGSDKLTEAGKATILKY